MDGSLIRWWKNLRKGGLMCLLCCLVASSQVQAQFIKMKEASSSDYGGVYSPEIEDAILASMMDNGFSFQEWSSSFRMSVQGTNRPMLGSYHLRANRIFFQPRFLPDPQLIYDLYFNEAALAELLATKSSNPLPVRDTVRFRASITAMTSLTGVYPNSSTLPSNALRIYLYFSQPMGFSNPYEFITLLDGNEEAIDNAFVEVPKGLWNKERTRLTLLFHPGRVKQEVGPNRAEGAVLRTGERYTLSIDKRWPDANGSTLAEAFAFTFEVVAGQRAKLTTQDWILEGTCLDACTISVTTSQWLDREVLTRFTSIVDSSGEEVDFKISAEGVGKYDFKSEAFQKGETYSISMDPRTEDICGNTFLNAFDYEIGQRVVQGEAITMSVRIP